MSEGLFCSFHQSGPIALAIKLEILPGETLALVGASGSGKTTVLRAIAGLYHPRYGRVRCGGQVWMDMVAATFVPARDRRIGLVSQHYALFPHLTARRNVMEAALHLPRSDRHDAAGDMLDRVGLRDLADRFPGELSGGQRQRVAIARALARDPVLLLLDEPFSAVDHPTRRLLRELVEEIRASFAIPIIVVSHDVEDALRLAHTVCFLQDGICQEIGSPRTLLHKPDGKLARWIGGSGELALDTRLCADQAMRSRNGMNSAWPVRTSTWHEALSGTVSGEFHGQHDRTGEA